MGSPMMMPASKPDTWNIGDVSSVTVWPEAAGGVGGSSPSASAWSTAMRPRTMALHISTWTKPMSPRCEMSAPLARPVVPEVKRMSAGSSSSMGTSGNAAPGAYAANDGQSRSISMTVHPRSMPATRLKPTDA